jgi:outer membrane protein OmpA-like peptidoglycan-associated protein
MIRIEVPETGTLSGRAVEQDLEHACRAELPGIYFAFASAELQPASDAAISGVATLLARHGDWSLQIEGHTDSIGDPAANQQLSLNRAEAVRAALVEHHAIAAGRLRPAGFGATRPREPNATIEGRARNRRVELVRNCAAGPR